MSPLRHLAALAMVAPLALGGCDVSPPATVPRALEPICSAPVAAEPALYAAVEAAAARWSAATGCAVEMADGGVPFRHAAHIVREDGRDAAAWTEDDRSAVWIHERNPDAPRSVLHEMGHVLGAGHVETDGVLSGERGYLAIIDEASLTAVCSVIACPAFRPEAP